MGVVICDLTQISIEQKSGPWHVLAEAYAETARIRSEDHCALTPIAVSSKIDGGKLDDISVVVGIVARAPCFSKMEGSA